MKVFIYHILVVCILLPFTLPAQNKKLRKKNQPATPKYYITFDPNKSEFSEVTTSEPTIKKGPITRAILKDGFALLVPKSVGVSEVKIKSTNEPDPGTATDSPDLSTFTKKAEEIPNWKDSSQTAYLIKGDHIEKDFAYLMVGFSQDKDPKFQISKLKIDSTSGPGFQDGTSVIITPPANPSSLPKYSLTVDGSILEFSEFTTIKTSGRSATTVPITRTILKEGFLLSVKKDIGVASVKIKSTNDPAPDADTANPDPVSFIVLESTPTDNPTATTYLIKDFNHIENDIVYIMIERTKKNPHLFIKLKVSKATSEEETSGPPNQNSGGKPTDCPPILLGADPDCTTKELTKHNDFGEELDYYDKHKIVYLYDFNPDIHKRALWKIERVRKKRAYQLSTTIANFNKDILTPKSQVEIKVVNVNKFLYDVDVTGIDVDHGSEPPFLFRELFLGDSTGVLGSVMNLFKSGITTQSIKNLQPNFDLVECILTNINTLQAEALKAYSPCDDFPCCQTVKLGNAYKAIADQIIKAKIEMSTIQNVANAQKKKLTELRDAQKKCQDIVTQITTLTAIEKRSADQDKQLADLNKKKCTDDQMKPFDEIVDLQKEVDASSVITEINSKLPSEIALRKLIVFIENIVAMNQTHAAGPFFPDGNLFDLQINIKTKDTIPDYFGIPAFANTIGGQLPVKYKGFVSFSSGSFISLEHRLVNKTYDWQQVPYSGQTITDTTSYRLVESGKSRHPMGFAAMANMEWRVLRSVGIGSSVGVGLTIEKEPRPAYLAGLSIFFGNARQFAITGGMVGMEVKRLSNNYQSMADAQIKFKTKPTDAIKYYDEFKVGTFIAVTYTPFKSIARDSKSKSSTSKSSSSSKAVKEDTKNKDSK